MVDRFLARTDLPPFQYRALRHLDARNEHFGAAAWMDAWTEVDRAGGFRYEVVAEGGSGYIRSHVLRARRWPGSRRCGRPAIRRRPH